MLWRLKNDHHETAKDCYGISALGKSFSAPAGSSTAMVVPLSELSSTQTEPPWRSAISHTNESPSPAPPYSRLRDLSTRKIGWKMLCRYSYGMPQPVSETRIRSFSVSCVTQTRTEPPGRLYLTAFSVRLKISR